MEHLVKTLKRLPLFDSLSEENIVALTGMLESETLDNGEILFHKGDIGDALYIIDDGRLKVVTTNQLGEEVVLNEFGSGESFGEMSLVDEQPRSATAVALSDTKLLRLNRDDFLSVVTHDPAFALEIIRDVSEKLRFAATYIQKATEWSQYIAKGDYSAAMGEIQNTQSSMEEQSDEARAGAFMSAFFQMIEGVKEREENLRREVQQLRIVIDETKRTSEVEEITKTDYFQDLQKRVREIRQQNSDEE